MGSSMARCEDLAFFVVKESVHASAVLIAEGEIR
jgi:hypothetical protein